MTSAVKMAMCYTIKWSIENFYVCYRLSGNRLILPEFENPSTPNPCEISLVDTEDGEGLSLFIVPSAETRGLAFKLKLTTSVLDVAGKQQYKRNGVLLFPSDGMRDSSLFAVVDKHSLDNQGELILPDGKLYIQMDLHVDYDYQCVLETSPAYILMPSDMVPPDLSELSKDIAWLFESRSYSDFEWNRQPVHKAILSARSPVFAKMFRGDLSMDLGDFKNCAVVTMLMYMYMGHPPFESYTKVNTCYPFQILDAAVKYQVPLLEDNLSVPVVHVETLIPCRSLDFTWVIEGLNITNNLKGILRSCRFCDTNSFPVTWSLALELGDGDLGIYLTREETQIGYKHLILVQGTFSIINVENEECHYVNFEHTFKMQERFCIQSFISKQMLREKKDILCPNSSLKIHCNLKGFDTQNSLMTRLKSLEIPSILEDFQATLPFANPNLQFHANAIYYRRLARDLKSLYLSEKLWDLILRTKDSEFKVHKCILAARCPGLRHDLMNNIYDGKIYIFNVETPIMENLLFYIYSGELIQNLSGETAKKMYSAARIFKMPVLQQKCENFILSILTVRNAVAYQDWAKSENCRAIETSAEFFANLKSLP